MAKAILSYRQYARLMVLKKGHFLSNDN